MRVIFPLSARSQILIVGEEYTTSLHCTFIPHPINTMQAKLKMYHFCHHMIRCMKMCLQIQGAWL